MYNLQHKTSRIPINLLWANENRKGLTKTFCYPYIYLNYTHEHVHSICMCDLVYLLKCVLAHTYSIHTDIYRHQ